MTQGIVKPREHLYVLVQLLRNSILAVPFSEEGRRGLRFDRCSRFEWPYRREPSESHPPDNRLERSE